MRSPRLIVLLLGTMATVAQAATTINVSNTVTVPAVKRFGISGIAHYYYDRLLLKNLVWQNAGFEGLLFQSMIRCQTATANGCVDTDQYAQWPTDFWDGGTYEFVLGTAKGRTGTVLMSVAPVPPAGTTWTFANAGTTPAAGDYFIARKYFPGGADIGWNPFTGGGATITTETVDLPPNTDGLQCIRLSASGAGQFASIINGFGSFSGTNFVLMNGNYRIAFKAKGAGGSNNLTLVVQRGSTVFKSQTVALTPSWATYTVDFSAAEGTNPPVGLVVLNFSVAGASALIDDVSLVQLNTDPTNTTVFRDIVVSVLRDFNPGILRCHNLELGETLDNLVVPTFGHIRTEFHSSTTNKGTVQYGWHDFLELCELLHTEPYLVLPIAFSTTDMSNLMEYLGGPATSPYGAKRAARGHSAPWTDSFTRIHLEFANEAWNPVYDGAIMFPADYGHRGSDLFAVARQSPYYSSKFNLILGVQAAAPFNTLQTHNASANHDMLAIGPYMATVIDNFADNEQLFGSLFAEASWWSIASVGPVKQTYDQLNASSRPVPMIVYEVNLHTTQGSITQSVLDTFTPSVGAGLAVANHMLNMLRQEQVRDQMIFSLAGYQYTRTDLRTVLLWGITRDIGVTDRKRPQYLAIKLVNEALAGDLVQTTQSGDNPMWNEPLTNRIQMDNIPFIQTFAFVNGSRKGIVIFNLHRTSPLDVNFIGTNAPQGSITMKRLTSANLTDTNEDANTVVTTTQQLSNFDPAQPLTLPPYSMTVLLANQNVAGDVNGDGQVSVADVFYLINNLFAAGPPPVGSGDVNGDAVINVADVFYLINYLFAAGPAPH